MNNQDQPGYNWRLFTLVFLCLLLPTMVAGLALALLFHRTEPHRAELRRGGEGERHRYTCREILGDPPKAGYIAILPPHWSAVATICVGDYCWPDFRVWDENKRLVCDEAGHDVRGSIDHE